MDTINHMTDILTNHINGHKSHDWDIDQSHLIWILWIFTVWVNPDHWATMDPIAPSNKKDPRWLRVGVDKWHWWKQITWCRPTNQNWYEHYEYLQRGMNPDQWAIVDTLSYFRLGGPTMAHLIWMFGLLWCHEHTSQDKDRPITIDIFLLRIFTNHNVITT